MKEYIVSILCFGLCGCGSAGGILSSVFGSAGGAAAGHALSKGSIEGTVAGGAAGALLGGGAWAWKEHSDKKAFDDGYVRGRADAAKSHYRKLQEQQQSSTEAPRFRRLTITIPERLENGVLYEAQTQTIVIAE